MRTPSTNRSSGTKPFADASAIGSSPGNVNGGTEKFPDFDTGHAFGTPNGREPSPRWQQNGATNPNEHPDRWHPRRESRVRWAPRDPPPRSFGHGKQKSISHAIRQIRSGSMSQNAHEIADALRAPVSYKLITLCVMWYWSSALTNTSSKSILTAFDKPATLTLVQFGFVSSYCILFSVLASTFPRLRNAIPALKNPIRAPSRDVIVTTLPLAAFQIAGHLLSSTATSKIPVSLVHTIKGLSPLFTVLAYRFIFDIQYPRATYLSLVPLTAGVMLACSGKHSFEGEYLGIFSALLATMIFVTQNIFSKRLFNEAARAEEMGLGAQSRKLDKLNLLCYSSGMAFIITGPIWLWSEGIGIIGDFLWDGSLDLAVSPNSFDHGRLTLEFIFNGTFHFAQNILAFVLLSMVSPVTYSVASLIKRVFVIIIAIIWFRSPTTNVQGAGITLTFLGLYLYDRSNMKNKADQRARSMTESKLDQSILPILPLHVPKQPGAAMSQLAPGSSTISQTIFESPIAVDAPPPPPLGSGGYTNGHSASNSLANDAKKSDDLGRGRIRGTSNASWLPPGTRQEDTWRLGDGGMVVAR
ncbi:triose-phosphate transporter family-domain-containing protein [Lasiosphaeria miniovina]|uniref:Triose-phosphate transporter family-domain-containing protein n=1 Tax=Lasiosphaeria miniovina TaxID=1954250 RepID=A0AA39ZZM8_9PEZI|nr:triose-phosphate transporter family-domain-containing protein [Lasiosphaeria miniovina]KAK0706585.1 triose-phosphate transporter family-domain-containing protein [Lasiosphaeria miniovina]